MKEATTGSIREVDRNTGVCSAPVALAGAGGSLDDGLAYDDEGSLYSILRTGLEPEVGVRRDESYAGVGHG